MESKDVNDFLKKDFWAYMYQGGIHPGKLTGASFDLAPTGHTNTNSTEKTYVDTMGKAERAQYLALTVLVAIKDCTDFEYHGKHRTILETYFIQNLNNQQTQVKVGMNDSEYKSAKRDALKEFIKRYDYWRDARDCPELPPLFYPQKPKKRPKSTQK
ncbi:hypothetical protein [Lactobacillus crispatus]|uniref:hypothetical protein n=1 Tax=Lactobacillus crispatus TaxID=47770 RepID=UPI0022E4274C|nr:hypothetical protein [Lactobacillus crispatus]